MTGLVDLTTATSLTAVVQTRGRALRVDAGWPDKVAVTWTVTCVSERHPKGANDWDRLVRKHTGFFGVDSDGTVADGVAHLDGSFSPYAPPPVATFDAVNARMLTRAQRRTDIADAWRVGQPYDDRTAVAVRLTGAGVAEMPEAREPREAALTVSGLTVLPGTDAGARTPDRGPPSAGPRPCSCSSRAPASWPSSRHLWSRSGWPSSRSSSWSPGSSSPDGSPRAPPARR